MDDYELHPENPVEPEPIEPTPISQIPPEFAQPVPPDQSWNIPPASPLPPTTEPPLTPEEERTWAMVAHLSIIINLFTGIFSPLVPLAIYLIFKNRSRYIAFQSLQALVFQLVFWVGGIILATIIWSVTLMTLIIVIGVCLMPLALLITVIPVAAMVYGIVAGFLCNQGQDFQYYLIGPWLANQQQKA